MSNEARKYRKRHNKLIREGVANGTLGKGAVLTGIHFQHPAKVGTPRKDRSVGNDQRWAQWAARWGLKRRIPAETKKKTTVAQAVKNAKAVKA